MTSSRQNSILLTLEKEPLKIVKAEPREMICIDPSIDSNITLVTGGLLEKDTRLQIHKIKENVRVKRNAKSPGSLEFGNKLAEKSKGESIVKHRKPQRSFSSKWLSRPELRDWVCPISNKPGFVFCKLCKGFLRAHLHDLKKHAVSRKHRKRTVKAPLSYSAKELTNSSYSSHLENIETSASSSTNKIQEGAHGSKFFFDS